MQRTPGRGVKSLLGYVQARRMSPPGQGCQDKRPEGQSEWATPVYDARGNMTTVPKPSDLTATYAATYDAWNRLVELKSGANVVLKCEYDGLGRRTKKHINTSSPLDQTYDEYQHFFYTFGWQLLETRLSESENTGPETLQPEYQYIWSVRYIDAPVLRDKNTDTDDLCDDERLYFANDANMNVTALFATDGTVLERYVYDPYGKVTIYDDDWSETRNTSSYDNRILFAGYYFDNETGLYHVRNRYYHPYVGWITRDPLGYADGMSLYEYCRSGPLGTTDSSGLLVKEAIAAYKAFRGEGHNPIEAARRTLVAGAIAKVAFDYGEAARAESIEQGSTPSEAAGIANALRHAAGSAALTKVFGEGVAKKIMDSHEEGQEDTPDSRVDQYNNEVGRRIGKESDDWDEIKQKVENALKKGDLVTHEDDPRVNPPNTAKQKPA